MLSFDTSINNLKAYSERSIIPNTEITALFLWLVEKTQFHFTHNCDLFDFMRTFHFPLPIFVHLRRISFGPNRLTVRACSCHTNRWWFSSRLDRSWTKAEQVIRVCYFDPITFVLRVRLSLRKWSGLTFWTLAFPGIEEIYEKLSAYQKNLNKNTWTTEHKIAIAV